MRVFELLKDFLKPFSSLVYVNCSKVLQDDNPWAVCSEAAKTIASVASSIGIGPEVMLPQFCIQSHNVSCW